MNPEEIVEVAKNEFDTFLNAHDKKLSFEEVDDVFGLVLPLSRERIKPPKVMRYCINTIVDGLYSYSRYMQTLLVPNQYDVVSSIERKTFDDEKGEKIQKLFGQVQINLTQLQLTKKKETVEMADAIEKAYTFVKEELSPFFDDCFKTYQKEWAKYPKKEESSDNSMTY